MEANELVFKNVHYWLQDNQELMARHDFESDGGVAPCYMSDNMNVSSRKVKGVCYLIHRFGADLASS